MEEKKDVICWASFLDIEVSAEFSVYFSSSHVCDVVTKAFQIMD